MKICWLVLGSVLCGWSALASLTGDVNGDGAVNVADWVRARKIADGELAFEPAADVDGDSAVTEVDAWLIQEAVLGRPVPERVDSRIIGPSGGTLSHGNVTVTFDAGASGSGHVALFRCPDEAVDEETTLQNVYMVCGVTTNQAGMDVAFSNCGSDRGLCVGSYLFPFDADEMSWHWHRIPGNGFDRSGTTVSRAFPAPTDSPLAVLHSIKFATATAVAPPAVTAASAEKPVSKTAAASTVPGYKYSGFKYTGWIGDLFHVYTPNWGTVSYDDLRNICGILNDAVIKMNGQLDFPLSEISSRFPLEVYVLRDLQNYGEFVNIPLMPWKIEIRSGLPANELKATLGHELMHFILDAYCRGDRFAFETMEDAITTWFEAIAADNPSYLSVNYTRQPSHVLKSLFVPITRQWSGFRNFGPQQERGYANSAFIDYHFSSHPGWTHALAAKVSGGQNIERALNSLFTENYGALYDLERQYLQFARDYLMYEPDCYSSKLLPSLIFSRSVPADLKQMYKLFQIKQASTNLWEEQTVDLTVQDYGCGVVQWTVLKPDRIFAPRTKLRVSGPAICTGLDLIVRYQDENQNWHPGIVTGTFDPAAEENEKWSCAIELPEDALNIMLFALATMGNGGSISDYAEEHEITLTTQFEGDYYMPMQESFIRFTELSSREAYYDQQITSDAIVRIVDPTGTAGLENFSVYRWTDDYSQPGVNYTVNVGISGMTATRRTNDAFQIQLFSNTTVPDLPPYTINISTSGYLPVTRDYQTPLIAGDGTPQLELMVYYASESSQVYPGEAAYRIQHEVTSAAELRQSADGLSGGIAVDIPAQIDGHTCLIYLIASEADGSLGHTAFTASIYSKKEDQ